MFRARKLAGAALSVSLVTLGGIGTTVLSAGDAHAATCPTARQIVTDIDTIASVAGGLNSRLGTLTLDSNPGQVRSVAQTTANDLFTMSNEFNADAGALDGCPKSNSADSQTVANAFDTLAGTTKQMLATLVGDHPIFAQFGATAPIANSLRTLEAGFDAYSYALLAVVPSAQQSAVTDDQITVDASLATAVTIYDQLCIPSPLYPTLKPICTTF